MKHYLLRLTLNAPQSVIIDQLKSNGAELIQTSDGICLKTDQSLDALKKLLGKELENNIDSIDTNSIDSFSEDIQAFIKQ